MIVVLAQQIGVMFSLMAVGFLLSRRDIMSETTTRDIGKILLNVVIPAVIVKSFWIEHTPERAATVGVTLLVSLAAIVLAAFIGRVVFPHDSIAEFSATFSNAGFIGIPLVSATLGERSVLYIVGLIALLNISQWTYGQRRLSGDKGKVDVAGLLASPMLVAFVLGLILFLTGVPKPTPVADFLESISGLNTPLAMLVLGAYLAGGDIAKLVRRGRLYVVGAIRLVVVPLVTLAMLVPIPCATDIKLAILLAASAPTGANVALFCQQLGKDSSYACGLVCMTTLLSVLTLPLVTMAGGLAF